MSKGHLAKPEQGEYYPVQAQMLPPDIRLLYPNANLRLEFVNPHIAFSYPAINLQVRLRKSRDKFLKCVVVAVSMEAEDDGMLDVEIVSRWNVYEERPAAHCDITVICVVKFPSGSRSTSRFEILVSILQSTDQATN